jgi:hypothetical protein
LASGAAHVLRVRKDAERMYWVGARAARPDQPWLARGVELHWNRWHQAIGTSELLDSTPGSRHGKDDAALVLGRTYSDDGARVHITPLRRGEANEGGVVVPYYDVAVRLGAFAGNQAPELQLEVGSTEVGVGESVVLTAIASDINGDELAYSWDLGEGIPGDNRAVMTHAWTVPGEYVVRCEVSDLKGGRAARHAVVRVGGVRGLRIQGRVLGPSGEPLMGVRVHNGQAGTNTPYAPEYRWAYTDSDGRYTLVGMLPGSYDVGAVLAGYRIQPLNFIRPLVLNQFTGVDVDFIAAALPRVSVTVLSGAEELSGRAARFRIARSGPTNEPLRVYFRVGGSAAPGEDYTPWGQVEVQTNVIPTVLDPVTQTIEFGYVDLGPGLLSTNLDFAVVGDAVAEGPETLVVTLAYPVTRTMVSETETNTVDIPGWEVLSDNGREAWFQTRPEYQLGAAEEAVATVVDGGEEAPTLISIVALERVVSENAGDTASFLVTRTGRRPSGTLLVPLSVTGTAVAGDDYVPLPGVLRIGPDDEAVRLTVSVLDDRFVEGNETVEVLLGDGDGYRVGGRTATISIVDNDLPGLTVAVLDPVISENGGRARVTLQRLGDLGLPLEVDYLVGGTASAGADYVALSGRVVIPAATATVTLEVEALDDRLLEGDETVEIRIGDSPVYNVVGPGSGVVTIRDDEYPTVTVEALDDEATEGADDPGSWVIRRSGSLAAPLEVHYRFGGSAQHQADFIAIGDRITIPAGQSQVVLVVTPIDDGFREDTETIAIELLEAPGYALGVPARAGITLLDNDDPEVAVGFALLTSRGPESMTAPELVVRISGNPDEGPENAITVAWEVLGGTATRGVDYVLEAGTVVFEYADPDGDEPLGNRVATIPLQVLDDSLVEPDESLVIRLRIAPTEMASEDPEAPPTLVTNGLLDVLSGHTYTIVDDDAAEVTVVATTPVIREGGVEPGVFSIRRTGATNTAQTVVFDLSGLAAAGSDYVDVPRVVTLAPGRDRFDVVIVPVDDPVAEFRENVRLTLVSAPGARIGDGAGSADIQIDDNDGTIEFTAARWTVSEGLGTAVVTIRRWGDTNQAATAWIETVGGTATAVGADGVGDYVSTNALLRFGPGEWLREFGVTLVDDPEAEEPETVVLALSQGTGLFPLGGQNVATLTILDDDALITTGTNSPVGIESDGDVRVVLERSGPVADALVLEYQTRDITAIEGEDYVGASGVVEFEVGQRSAELRIVLLDDTVIEGDEAFVLDLFAVGGRRVAEIGVGIADDDCSVRFLADRTEVDEDAGVIEVAVVRDGSAVNPIRVDYTTVGGTAREGLDYVRTAGVLEFRGNRFEVLTNGTGEVEFRPGETNLWITVPILNDVEGERDEEFGVALLQVRSGLLSGGGDFVTLGSLTNTTVVIRDNEAPGRVDEQFQPGLGADASVRALALQSDGKVLVGGDFGVFDGVVSPRLARLHADGILDRSFNVGRGFDGSVLAVAEVDDGRILVGGVFTTVDGGSVSNLVRLEPDGTRSAAGALNADGPVRAIVVGGDGIYVGGGFRRVGGVQRHGVARLLSGGQMDPGFEVAGSGVPDVRALAESEGGGVWVGGRFGNWAGSGVGYLVRLDGSGALDRTQPATAGPNGPVEALARSADGSVYLGGTFTAVGGVPRSGVARWLAGGGLDASFDPGSGMVGAVLGLAVDREARAVAAGGFGVFAGVDVGRFVRMTSDGSLDDMFFRGVGANDVVRAVALQPDGAILLGGDFTAFNGRPRFRVVRIHAEEKYADGVVEFELAVIRASERSGEVEVGVRRTGTGKNEARVRYRTGDITAQGGVDYVAAAGELVFAAGQTRATFRVTLIDDVLAEGSESVALVLEEPEGVQIGRQASASLVIEDDEAAVGWELVRVGVAEDGGSMTLLVRRSGALEAEARVRVATSDLGARSGEDYVGREGEVVFAPGEATAEVVVQILDDALVEGPEEFEVTLSDPVGGIALGSQTTVVVRIEDDDRMPTHYTLTVETAPGGVVIPGGGRFATNTVVSLSAIPDRGFEFARWEGSVVSADNPLSLLMDRNHVLTARFRPREYLETFESGTLSALPWETEGDAPWRASRDSAATGQWSARSGDVADGGTSVLRLVRETPSGGGSFDFRTESEAGWDFLEFWVNGERRARWSGVLGWQTHAFNLSAGVNRLEWRFTRDRTFGGTADAVWIDNLDLPDTGVEAEAPRLRWAGVAGACRVEITGQAGRLYVLEASDDLREWRQVAAGVAEADVWTMTDPGCSGRGGRYYRVRVE